MSHLKAKMHQIRFWLGLCPRPRWGSSQGESEREREGKEREGGEGKGRRESSPPPPFQIPGSTPDWGGVEADPPRQKFSVTSVGVIFNQWGG